MRNCIVALLILICVTIGKAQEKFYKVTTDPVTVTFQPQFGNTVPLLNSGLNLGLNNWILKPNVLDVKYEYKFENLPTKTGIDIHQLMRQSFVIGIDYAYGPKIGSIITPTEIFNLSHMQKCVTVYIRFQINGKDFRQLLSR